MEYELYHHGILGMKWGIRRYQNPDGSLTPAGRKRLADKAAKVVNAQREYDRAGIFKRGKAREKLDKAKASYEKFSNRLEYGKMSDEKLLSASKDFVRNNNVSVVVTSQNVNAGQRSLEDKIRLYSTIVTAATSTVALVNNARQAWTGYQAGKQEMQIKANKEAREQRKFFQDERIANAKERRENQKFLDDRYNAERKYQNERADAERKYRDEKSKDDRDSALSENRLKWQKYYDERADAGKSVTSLGGANRTNSTSRSATTSSSSSTRTSESKSVYDSMSGTPTAKAMAKLMNSSVDKSGNVTVKLSQDNVRKWYEEQMKGRKAFKPI